MLIYAASSNRIALLYLLGYNNGKTRKGTAYCRLKYEYSNHHRRILRNR